MTVQELIDALILSKDDWNVAANAIDRINELLKDFSDDK